MHPLTNPELYKAIEYAKSIDENTGHTIIQKFQSEQPALAHSLFTLFPSIIAGKNQDMAHLFMDLCFDIICIYQHAFGEIPTQDTQWLQKQSALAHSELQALTPGNNIDPKIIKKLQQRFAHRANNEVNQTELVAFMNQSIHQYAVEISPDDQAIKMTENMVLTAIRLFNTVYSASITD